jgi:hypothetical protein
MDRCDRPKAAAMTGAVVGNSCVGGTTQPELGAGRGNLTRNAQTVEMKPKELESHVGNLGTILGSINEAATSRQFDPRGDLRADLGLRLGASRAHAA